MIELKNISKKFQKVILCDVNYTFTNEYIYILTGPSGSGKTTLLNIISTFLKPDSGDILYKGISLVNSKNKKIIDFRRNVLGYITQELNLDINYSILDNFLFHLSTKNKQNSSCFNSFLKQFQLDVSLEQKVSTLSAGEKQRINIIATLLKKPNIILADEPCANLDYKNTKIIYDNLVFNRRDKIIIIVTHDVSRLSEYSEKIKYIKIEDNKIHEITKMA